MIEIALYLMIAILFGYLFGWLITQALLKEKFERKISNYQEVLSSNKNISILEEELHQYKIANSQLISDNNKILLDNNEKKLQIHSINKEMVDVDDLNKRLKAKNRIIEKLTFQLSIKDNELMLFKNKESLNSL
jgi:predicted RNase H-like nuclease (RuvC/YqgF family)